MKWYSFLLAPFAVLYWSIVALRNFLYDHNIAKSFQFDIPVIVLGNLSLGGTGKTPHTIYVAKVLHKADYNVCVLSRGYRRKTKGFLPVTGKETASEVGDEPLLMAQKLDQKAHVFVCENRVLGIIQILKSRPETDVVVLDDAFQHRSLKGGFNILLTTAARPFYKNRILPLGTLRDQRSSYKRADVIVVTKASDNRIQKETANRTQLPTYSSQLQYENPKSCFDDTKADNVKSWLVVTGIAQPEYLVRHLENKGNQVKLCQFPDHHQYSEKDIQKVQKIFDNLASDKKGIITTVKDWVKIAPFVENTSTKKFWFLQDLSVTINAAEEFDHRIIRYVSENQRDNDLHTK